MGNRVSHDDRDSWRMQRRFAIVSFLEGEGFPAIKYASGVKINVLPFQKCDIIFSTGPHAKASKDNEVIILPSKVRRDLLGRDGRFGVCTSREKHTTHACNSFINLSIISLCIYTYI